MRETQKFEKVKPEHLEFSAFDPFAEGYIENRWSRIGLIVVPVIVILILLVVFHFAD